MMSFTARVNVNDKIRPETILAITVTMDRISGAARKVAVREAPANKGQLRNSIETIQDYRPPVFVGGIQTGLPYAIPMELGVPASKIKPPTGSGTSKRIPALQNWAMFKFGVNKKEGLRIAFAVIWKHSRSGIPAHHFFKKAEIAVEKEFPRELKALDASITQAWNKGGSA